MVKAFAGAVNGCKKENKHGGVFEAKNHGASYHVVLQQNQSAIILPLCAAFRSPESSLFCAYAYTYIFNASYVARTLTTLLLGPLLHSFASLLFVCCDALHNSN